jgi:hypothetical protein
MSQIIKGGASSNLADVNAFTHLKVTTEVSASSNPGNVGCIRTFSENDPGAISGQGPLIRSPETTSDYRLRVGIDTILFTDTFNYITQNTNNWNYIFVTQTATQPGNGTLQIGTVQGTAATHGTIMKTFQYFPIIGTAPISAEFEIGQFTAALITNEVVIFGLGNPTVAGTPPTDGVFIQITSAGVIGVLAYNGTLTQTGTLINLNQLTVGKLDKFVIVVGEGLVEYWWNDVLLNAQTMPVSNGQPFMAASQPAFIQKYCTGAVSNTNTIRVSDVTVSLLDLQTAKPWSHQMAGQGLHGSIPLPGIISNAVVNTSLNVNAAGTPISPVVMTNTTATSTGLGGITAITPSLAVHTDGILFSYQNPAPSITQTGRNLYVTGVRIQGAVSQSFVGGPVIYAYGVAWGHTAVSMATAETSTFTTATTHAPRRTTIGIESYSASAVAGAVGSPTPLNINFTVPLVVRPSEFIAITARNVGTVTSVGTLIVTAGVDSYWE